MYRPSYSINNNWQLAVQLIKEFPLGLLVSNSDGKIESNYLPFLVQFEGDELILLTHFARSNPHWKNLGSNVLVSFQGPNRYISPVMYVGKNNVPTWNYAAVQIEGEPELIVDSTQIKEILNQSVKFFESRNKSNWQYDLPQAMQAKLESAIVGLRIRAKGTAKFKLGQNRNDEDYKAMLGYLETSQIASDEELLQWIRRSPK